MKSKFKLLLLIATLSLCSCSKVQVSQDFDNTYNFSSANSYNWNRAVQSKANNNLKDNELLAERFISAIDTKLQSQGFVLSDTPDVLVSYTYTVTSRLQSESIQPSVGIGYGRYGRYGGFGVQSGSSVRQYDQGLLLINMHSGNDGKLIWKGTGTREVFTHNSPEQLTQSVRDMVETTLAQFPPTK